MVVSRLDAQDIEIETLALHVREITDRARSFQKFFKITGADSPSFKHILAANHVGMVGYYDIIESDPEDVTQRKKDFKTASRDYLIKVIRHKPFYGPEYKMTPESQDIVTVAAMMNAVNISHHFGINGRALAYIGNGISQDEFDSLMQKAEDSLHKTTGIVIRHGSKLEAAQQELLNSYAPGSDIKQFLSAVAAVLKDGAEKSTKPQAREMCDTLAQYVRHAELQLAYQDKPNPVKKTLERGSKPYQQRVSRPLAGQNTAVMTP